MHKIQILLIILESVQRHVERHKGMIMWLITATVEDIGSSDQLIFFGVDALIVGRGKRDEFGEYTGEVES